MPFFNGDLTNNLLPTTAQIKKYLKLANAKDKRDVRSLMSFLQRLQEVDGYLMGLVTTLKLAVKDYNWDIRLPLEYKMSSVEEKQLAETKRRFRRSQMIKTIDDIVDGYIFGMSNVRLIWDNTTLGTMVTKKITSDLTDLDFSDTTDSLAEVITSDKGDFTKIELDPDINLTTRYNPIKNRTNYIGSYMRSIMLLSYLKYNNRWNWADNNERHGIPPTYATHPEGLDDEEVAKLIAMVEKLKKDAVAVFPEYVKVLYEQALKGDSTDSFAKFVDACNLEMAVTLHGQNLTTQVSQGGSRAAASVHNQIDDLVINGINALVMDVITNQYLIQDFKNNYGEPKQDYFEFVLYQEGQEDYESNSRIIQNLFADPAVKANLPIKKDELYQKLGFTKPAEGDEII